MCLNLLAFGVAFKLQSFDPTDGAIGAGGTLGLGALGHWSCNYDAAFFGGVNASVGLFGVAKCAVVSVVTCGPGRLSANESNNSAGLESQRPITFMMLKMIKCMDAHESALRCSIAHRCAKTNKCVNCSAIWNKITPAKSNEQNKNSKFNQTRNIQTPKKIFTKNNCSNMCNKTRHKPKCSNMRTKKNNIQQQTQINHSTKLAFKNWHSKFGIQINHAIENRFPNNKQIETWMKHAFNTTSPCTQLTTHKKCTPQTRSTRIKKHHSCVYVCAYRQRERAGGSWQELTGADGSLPSAPVNSRQLSLLSVCTRTQLPSAPVNSRQLSLSTRTHTHTHSSHQLLSSPVSAAAARSGGCVFLFFLKVLHFKC